MPTYTLNNVNYTYTVGTVDASVASSSSASGEISLLSSFVVGGATYNVTSIAASAFFNNRTVTRITVPDSVTSIGASAFQYCTNLLGINIPNGVPAINQYTFSFCQSFTEINIPNSVTSIGINAFEYCDKITSLTLPNALTSIGASAFNQCYGLTSIEFPATLTSIGASNFSTTFVRSYVFKNSTLAATVGTIIKQIAGLSITFDYVGSIPASMMAASTTLTNLTLGPNITAIGASAFSGCTSLSSVIIPNSVTSIGASAFATCSKLSSVTIPNSVTSIGTSAFSGCSVLSSFTIPNTITIINDNTFTNCKSLVSVTIPSTVTSIGASAFSTCTLLSSVIIPNSVTSIGASAFYNCSSLSSFSVPASIVTIGTDAFFGCTNLVNIVVNSVGGTSIFSTLGSSTNLSLTFNYAGVIPDSLNSKIRNLTNITIGPNITKIGISSFDSCIFLRTIIIPDSVTIIENNAFNLCYRLQTVTISNSSLLTKIGNTAFNGCAQLTSINIPSTITTIGTSAFYGCSAMVSCTTSQSTTLLLTIPNSVFYNCTSLQSFIIPPSVTSIDYNLFYNCSSLTAVTIPPSVTSIGGGAFYNCSSLLGVTLPNLTILNTSLFFGCSSLINVNIPTTLTTIETTAFSGCASLTTLTIPQSVSTIRVDSFKNCTGLTSITVASTNSTYLSENGVLFDIDKTFLMVYPPKSLSTSYVIPSTVGIVSANAFCNCANLTSLTITASTVNIQNNSFLGFPNLSTIVLDPTHAGFVVENGVLFDIGKTKLMLYPGALANTSYVVPSTVTTIFSAAFYGAKNLTSVTIPSSVTTINDSVFYGCSGLTSVPIPSNATYIGPSAYYGCSSFTSLTIPSTVSTVEPNAFYGCSSLTSITFSSLLTRLNNDVFFGCSSLSSVTIPSTLTTIIGNPFRNCTNLTSITVHASNTAFSSENGIMFNKAKSTLVLYPPKLLNTSYFIPSTVTLINSFAFSNCSNLITVSIPSLLLLNDSTFINCSNLLNVIFRGSVPRINGTNFGAIGDTAVYDSTKSPNNVLNQLSMFTNTINQPTPTLTNFKFPSFTFTTVPYTFTPPTSDVSGGVFTYVSSNTTIATVSGNILTMKTVSNGTSFISATQRFTNFYGDISFSTFATLNGNSLYISQGNPGQVFSIPSKRVGDANFTLVPPTISDGGFSYSSSNTAVAYADSTGVISIYGPGVTTITFDQAGTINYIPISITADFAVDATTATITPTFGNFTVPAKLPGSAPFLLVPPTSNSNGAFTYTSSNSDVAFLSGDQVTIRQPGSCTIIATQAGNATYKSRSVSAVFVVSFLQATYITNFSVGTKTLEDASFNITPPTTNGDGLITYTSSNTSVATIVGSVVTIVGAGTSTITADQAGTNLFSAATASSVLTVNKATPTLTNFSVPTKTAVDASFSLIAPTSNSTGTFTYTSSNTAVATIVGNAITITGVGTSTITAVQASSTNYLSGSTTASFEVTQGVLVLSNFSVPTKSLGNADFTLVPPTTVSTGLITYTSSDTLVATVSGDIITIVGVGSSTITADQASTVNYTSATISATLTVLPAPTMSDFSVPTKSVLDGSFNLVAPTTDSDGLITYTSSNTAVATIVGSKVIIVGGGTTTITAAQAFTAVYGPGSISATLVVNKLPTIISPFTIPPRAINGGRYYIGFLPTSNRAGFINLTSSNTSIFTITLQPNQGIWYIDPVAAGNASIIATQASTSIYEAGTFSANLMIYPVGTYTYDNVNYEYNIGLGTASVLSGTTASRSLSSITILESFVIDGTTYTVNALKSAFSGWTNLTSISLPPTIETIGYGCFGSTKLTTFTFPPLVTVLDENVFSGSSLTSITIPSTLTTFKYVFDGRYGGSSTGAFGGCTKLVNVVINKYIPGFEYVFWRVNNANMSFTFDYPGAVPPLCLLNATGLKTLIIGNQITSIGATAFQNTGLTSVTLGSSLTAIGNGAFNLCSSLKNITLPSSLLSIGNGSFANCVNLSNIILPSSLTTIMYGAFENCTSFTSITLPSSITTIDYGLFINCTNLTNIVVKKYIGALAYTFNSINSLNMTVTFDYAGLVPGYVCLNTTKLKTVNMSNSITGVELHAFSGCTGMTEIIFPASITTIQNNAFFNCTNLNSVSFLGNIPTIGGNNFGSLSDTAFYKVDATANINTNSTAVTASLSMFTTKTVIIGASPTITNLLTPMKKYNDISFAIVDPSSNSSGAFTYTSSNTAVATVSGNVVTIGTSGSTTITATQAANYRNGVDYTSGTITSTFVVDNPPPILGPLLLTNKSLSDVSFSIVEPVKPANSSGTWTYTSSDVTKATISGNEVTLLDVGIVIITAAVSSDSNYCSTTITGRFSISPVDVTPSTFAFVSTSDVSNAIQATVQPVGNTVVLSQTVFTPESIALLNPSAGTTEEKVANRNGLASTFFDLYYNVDTITVPPAAFYLSPLIDLSNVTAVKIIKTSGTTTQAPLIVDASSLNLTTTFFCQLDEVGNSVLFNGVNTFTGYSVRVTKVSDNNYTVVQTKQGVSTTFSAINNDVIYYAGFKLVLDSVTGQLSTLQLLTLSNFAIPNKVLNSAPFTITPPTTVSSGSFTYTSSDTSIATIAGNVVTVVGLGTATITAVQARTATHLSDTITATLTVNKIPTVLSNFVVSAKTYGNAPFTITPPTTNSDGTFTYTSSNTAVATIDGSTVTILAVGSCTITAVNETSARYTSATITANFTVNKITPTITDFTVPAKMFGDVSFNIVPPTTDSSGTFTYTSSNTAVATISGSRINIVGGGSATITATQATTTNYLAGTITASLVVSKATPVLTNFSVPAKTFGNAAFTLVAPTTNSTGAFTYTSSNTAVATIAGSTITIVGAGTATISAVQATTTNFETASIPATLTVSQATPTITNFIVYAKVVGDATYSLNTPTTNSSGLFTYTSSDTSVATIAGNVVTIVGKGTSTITADQASTTNYLAGSITGSLIVRLTPTLSNFVIPAKTFGDAAFALVPPTTDSDGILTYTSSNTSVATISGTTITIVGGGTAAIFAIQSMTANYVNAETVANLVVSQATTVLTNFSLPAKTFGNAPFTITAPTTNGNGVFTYGSSNLAVATIVGNTVTIVGGGTSTISAHQTSTSNYTYAQSITTLTVNQATTVLSNFSVPTKIVGNAAFSLTAPTTNGNGAITYTSSNPLVATVSGTTVTVVGVGSCIITADQASTANYTAGTITANFVVNQITTVLSGFSVPAKQFADADFSLVAPTTNSPGTFTYTSSNTAVATIVGSTVTIVGVGSATISAVQASTTNYTSATVTATLTTSKATTVLTNFSVDTKTFGDASFSIVAPSTNSNGVFTYASSNTAVATVSGSTITIVGAGSSTITATQATNSNYLAATTTASFTVNKATTVLTNFSVPLKIIENPPFSIVAPTTNSNGAFTYTSSDTTIATIAGSVVTVLGVGTSTITASQAATSNFTAATTTAVFQVNNKNPIITNFVVPTKTFGNAAFSLVDPSSNSNGAFNYKSSNTAVATIVGNIVTIIGAGTSTITATQAVTADYVDGTITATLTVNKASTTVIYNALSNIEYTTPLAFKLNATTASPSMSGLMKYYINASEVYSTTVLTAGTYTITATFTPTSSNYSSSSATQSLVVDKNSTIIGFPTVSTIEYGTTLADFVDKTRTGVPGTFSFYYMSDVSTRVNLSLNTVLPAGQYEINADFTPTDAVNYSASSASTAFSVTQKSVTMQFSDLPEINYGQTLSSSLVATLSQSVDGIFKYYLDSAKATEVTSTTILNVGSYTLHAFFTPATANYTLSDASASLVVNKLTPTVTFSSIPSITHGTTLAAFISETVASVAGTFSFYLANNTQLTSSTVLTVGSYVIFCTFTPTDTSNYLAVNDAKVFSVTQGEVDPNAPAALSTITMSSINTFNYGTTMSAFINGTTVSAAGTLTFYASQASLQLLTESSVLDAGTYTIYCSFTPTDSSSFQATSASKTITVQKLSTTVRLSGMSTSDFDTSPLISTIAYGTSLLPFMGQFTTTASGTKTFYINDPSGEELTATTNLNVGVYTIYCKFDPADSVNFSSSSKTKDLTVTQTQVIMTYGPLSAITYGTTLLSRLSATIEPIVDGSMNYYINSVQVLSTTVLDASSHVITATFVPASSNYIGATSTATLVVNKSSTVVTYPAVQSVFFNSPIGAPSLSATVTPDVSGTMSYFTNSTFTNQVLTSTLLTQGVYTLYARFTPTSPNYMVSSDSTSLTVLGQTAPTFTFPTVSYVEAFSTLESIINGISTGVAGTLTFNKNSIAGAILTATSTFDVLGPFVIFCRFSPTDTVRYSPATATYTVNVKYAPVFFFNQRPSSVVTYGTNLAGGALATTVNQFNNTTITGTVTFSNGLTTNSYLTPGVYTVVATFTPTNTNIYTVVTASKQILVSKQPLTVNITSPTVKSAFIGSAPIDCSFQVWGILTALGDTFANSVNGTITTKYFSFDGTTALTSSYVYNTTFAGASQTYKIATEITGFSSTKYEFTSQTYTFTVNKYTPTINYTISAPNKTVVYGTPLGANQLNAVVSYNGVPVTSGSVVYTRSVINMDLSVNLQTVLDVGQYNLYAYYSDLSSNMYNSANTSMVATNVVTIAKATPVVSFPNIKTILVGKNLKDILNFTVATLSSQTIPGTFVFSYVNQSGATVVVNASTVLTRPPSSYTINAVFTPTNSARYTTSTGSITIGLSELSSTLVANRLTQPPFTYGKSFNQLYNVKVSPSIAGTYVYYNDVNTFNPASILDAGNYSYKVVFNPTSSSYVSSMIDVSFTVEKANLTISYAKPPTYGFQTANQLSLLQPTKSVALDGTLNIFLNSSLTNELTNATPMAIGTHTLYVRFTPVKNYNVATVTTTLTVTQIPLKLTYTTKSSTITYGKTAASLLDNSVVGSIGGSMQYYYDASFSQIVNSTDVLNVGTRTIYIRFVPTSSSYATAYATHVVKVNKAVLSLKYPALSAIEFGTTLQSSFKATALFDGSMNYSINNSEVLSTTKLNAGVYTIKATFQPRLPNNFTTTSASITQKLTVSKRSPVISFVPSNITQGTPFGPSMTATVSPNIPGTMRYFRNNTVLLTSTVLNSGNYNLVLTFTPTDSVNYKTSTMSSAITVVNAQQLAIINENTAQIRNAANNQTVSIVTQNPLLPSTMNVKVNKMTANQTSITAPTTSTAVTGLKFDFGNGAVGTNVTMAVSTLTVNLPNAANTPAIFFKFYDENGNSIVSKSNPVTLTLKLPKYKGKTTNIFLARVQDVGTLVDGTKIPLTSVNPTNPQNIDFTAVFTSNSVYVATEEEPTGSVTDALTSNMYAFEATGGFVMQRGFDDIKTRDMSTVETFDVTDSVQILFDVARFNAKLGLNKNTDNNEILSSLFNPVTDQFELDGSPINALSFTASEFIDGVIKSEQIISVGKYSTVYSDFRNYVATYFGFDGGFSSLFTAASEFAIDEDNHFDSESMMQLFSSVSTPAGSDAYINQMTGSISISNIISSLRYCIDTNCFGNRTPIADLSQNDTGSAVDPDDKNNYGVEDGFVAGDLIWIPTGTTLNLNLNIDVESFMPLNNVGPENISSSQTTNFTSGNFSRETTASTTNIHRTVRAPLLIKLVNGSTINDL